MPRAPIVCRRAVQCLGPASRQHIWISDEQLTRAFERFLHNTCTHQKRHGSHVPGPLEARRRAAKRRMTAAAATSPGAAAPPPFGLTLGDLFGYQTNRIPSWRYEPPSVPSPPKPQGIRSDEPIAKPFRALETSQSPQKRNEIQVPETMDADGVGSSLLVKHTKECLSNQDESFSKKVAIRRVVVGKSSHFPDDVYIWLAQLSWVLGPAIQLPCDPSKLLMSLANGNVVLPRLPTPEAVEFTRWLSHAPSKLRSQVRPVYRRLAKHRITRPQYTTHGVPGLWNKHHMDNARISIVLRTVWEFILDSKSSLDTQLLPFEIEFLSRIQRTFSNPNCRRTTIPFHDPSKFIDQIASRLVNYEKNPRLIQELAILLNSIPQKLLLPSVDRIARGFVQECINSPVLTFKIAAKLKTWLMLMRYLDQKIGVGHESAEWTQLTLERLAVGGIRFKEIADILSHISPTLEVQYLLHVLPYDKTIRETHQLEAHNFVRGCREYFRGFKGGSLLQFAELLHELHKASIPNHGIAEMIFHRVSGLNDAHVIGGLLRRLNSKKCKLSNVDFLYANLTKFLEKMPPTEPNIYLIMRLQQISEELNGNPSSELKPAAPRVEGTRQSGLFTRIVERARSMHHLPPAYASQSIGELESMDNEFCHQLAHQYSLDYTRNCRENWRSMYFLYRYLSDNSSPIKPIFTRALVRATIIRPFLENRFVSSRRLVWVCQIVAHVEGERVARRVEHIFHAWRGELIRYAKKKFVEAGGDKRGRAHVNTMKKLGLI